MEGAIVAKVLARRSLVQRSDVQQHYLDVRQMRHVLCQPLAIEDMELVNFADA